MNTPHNGEIRPDSMYSVREFCRRTGLSRYRIPENVPIRKVAGRAFVLGADFISSLGPPEKRPKRPCPFQDAVLGIVSEPNT